MSEKAILRPRAGIKGGDKRVSFLGRFSGLPGVGQRDDSTGELLLGIGPRTSTLPMWRSTTELQQRSLNLFCPGVARVGYGDTEAPCLLDFPLLPLVSAFAVAIRTNHIALGYFGNQARLADCPVVAHPPNAEELFLAFAMIKLHHVKRETLTAIGTGPILRSTNQCPNRCCPALRPLLVAFFVFGVILPPVNSVTGTAVRTHCLLAAIHPRWERIQRLHLTASQATLHATPKKAGEEARTPNS